jgi:hypothetical protein
MLRHRHPRERPIGAGPLGIQVPLIQAAMEPQTSFSSHRLRIAAPSNLTVDLPPEQWSVVPPDTTTPVNGERVYQSTELLPLLQFTATVAAGPSKPTTILQRVWVQTLLTDRVRRDRACFRLTTNEPSLTFRLPRGATPDDITITVAVNGQRTDRFRVSNSLDVQVDLSDAVTARETNVEIWYWFSAQPTSLGRLFLQSPTLAETTRAERIYWQLILPRHEHLAWFPGAITSENSWERDGFLWRRQARRSQAELELWASASQQPDVTRDIPSGFNVYLFSSVGSLGPRTVYTITRQLAVLSIAGFVLLSGTALLYFPLLRHPLLLLAVGVLLGAGALAYPEAALAAAQLFAAGVVLVLLTGVLMSLFSRPLVQRTMSRSLQPSSSDSRNSKQPPSRLSANSHVTTATLQAPVSVSAVGNEP